MTFDRLICSLGRFPKTNNHISEEEFGRAISRRVMHTYDSKTLWVLMLPWSGNNNHSHNLERRINFHGDSFASYSPPYEILIPDEKTTKRHFEIVADKVLDDLDQLKIDYGFEEFNMVGVSLGCVNACMIAKEYSFRKIDLVVPGHCLAESMWFGARTQHIKNEFEKNGISLEELKEEWKELAPENNLCGLVNRDVRVFLSKSDKVIPYRCGEKLVDKMHETGINPKVHLNNLLGHYGTALRFYNSNQLFEND